MAQRPPYPFTAIVGQERLKQALILNAISSSIGGVLVRGERELSAGHHADRPTRRGERG